MARFKLGIRPRNTASVSGFMSRTQRITSPDPAFQETVLHDLHIGFDHMPILNSGLEGRRFPLLQWHAVHLPYIS